MNTILKTVMVAFGIVVLSGCVEEGVYASNYYGHPRYVTVVHHREIFVPAHHPYYAPRVAYYPRHRPYYYAPPRHFYR